MKRKEKCDSQQLNKNFPLKILCSGVFDPRETNPEIPAGKEIHRSKQLKDMQTSACIHFEPNCFCFKRV